MTGNAKYQGQGWLHTLVPFFSSSGAGKETQKKSISLKRFGVQGPGGEGRTKMKIQVSPLTPNSTNLKSHRFRPLYKFPFLEKQKRNPNHPTTFYAPMFPRDGVILSSSSIIMITNFNKFTVPTKGCGCASSNRVPA
jgi:hypothetical protein